MTPPAIGPEALGDIVAIITKGADAPADALSRVAKNQRTSLIAELLRHGERAVADRVEGLTDSQVAAIYSRGVTIAYTGMSLPLSFCMAAIEAVEGASRPLASCDASLPPNPSLERP